MGQLRRRSWLRPRRFLPLLVALVSAVAFLIPAALGASPASAAPSPGYTASYIPAGTGSPEAVAVNPAADTIYLGDSAGQLIVIDGASNTVRTTLTISTGGVDGLAFDSATNTVYATVAGPEIAVINGATNAVLDIPVPAGVVPEGGIAVDSATDQIYFTDQAVNSGGAATGGGVFVVDGGTNKVVNSFSSGGGDPEAIAFDGSTNVVWVANLTGAVAGIDPATGAIVESVSLTTEAASVAVDSLTDTVYVAAIGVGTQSSEVAVINGSAGTLTTTLPLPKVLGVAVDPGADVVYATGGATTVIDGSKNSVADTLPNPGGRAVALDTATGSVYQVTSYRFPGLWAITPSTANGVSPILLGATSATFTAGTAGSVKLTVLGLPAPTLTVTPALPAGVTLSQSGTLAGTPSPGTGGVYPITIAASNGVAPASSLAFTLTVYEMPTLTVPAAVTLPVGVPVSVPFQVTGYPIPGVASIGALPAGVEVTQSSPGSWGLSGTPAAGSGGVYQAEFEAANTAGAFTAAMTILVPEAPTITSAASATFGSGGANGFNVTANCAPACTFSGAGLPSGLSLNSSGVLSGDPTAGTYTFAITASNSEGTATQEFTLTVRQSVAVGAEGGVLYAYTPQGAAEVYSNFGGVITAAPAVVAVPTPGTYTSVAPLFIATGSNGELWMYSQAAGWAPLGPSEALCIGSPAAVVTGTTLTVACEGLNQQLYYNTATLPATGMPAFTGPWTSLGGILSAGPAVAPIGGVLTFFATGTNGQVFTRTTTTGYTATPWLCIGHLAAATDASTGITIFACQGGDHTLWTATSSGAGWSAARSLGGQIVDGPGIAAAGGTTEYFAEGLDRSVWEWTQSTGWFTINVFTEAGAGAVALN